MVGSRKKRDGNNAAAGQRRKMNQTRSRKKQTITLSITKNKGKATVRRKKGNDRKNVTREIDRLKAKLASQEGKTVQGQARRPQEIMMSASKVITRRTRMALLETKRRAEQSKIEESSLGKVDITAEDKEGLKPDGNNDASTSTPVSVDTALSKLEDLIGRMDTDDPSQVPDTLAKLKHYICSSCTKCHSVEVVGKAVELGIVPKLVSLLKNEDASKVPWEACWMLVNITFYESDQCETLMNLDILPSLVKLASSSDQKAQEGAFDLLRNLAGSCAEMRDEVLDSGVSDVLLRLLEAADEAPHEVLDCGISLIANCFRTAFPFPESDKVSPFILPLGKLLSHNHPLVVEKSCWALDYIAYGPYNRIAAFCTTHEDSICRKLVSLLSHADQKVVNAAVATLGAISNGAISQTQAILGSGALEKFKDLLEHVDKKIVMRTLLALSNIAADGRDHIKAIIDAGIVPMAITVLNKGEPETAKDAVWLLRNMALDGNIDQIRYLVDVGIIPAICGVLTPEQVDFLEQSLKCIEVFLRIGQNDAAMSGKPNRNAQIMTACGGLAKLQSLTKCQEEDVQPLQMTISDLLSRYFQNQ